MGTRSEVIENVVQVGVPVAQSSAQVLLLRVEWPSESDSPSGSGAGPQIVCGRRRDDAFDNAVQEAVFAACVLAEPGACPQRLPARVCIEVPDCVSELAGPSVGLGAALATLATHPATPPWKRAWAQGVAASGQVSRTGVVSPVGRTHCKAHGLGGEWTRLLLPVLKDAEPVADPRVMYVRDLATAWQNCSSRGELAALQQRAWRRLDKAIPAAVPKKDAWLDLPEGAAAWTAWTLRSAPHRVTVIYGPPRSGRSRLLRHAADLLHRDLFIERQAAAADDVLLYGGGLLERVFASLLPDAYADDRERLQRSQLQQARRIWVFAEDAAAYSVRDLLELDERIRVLTTSTWLGEFIELGPLQQAVSLLPHGTPDERLTEVARAQVLRLTPWSQALVRSDVRHLDCLRVWTALSGRDTAPVLWLHRLLARRARIWAGSGPLAAELAAQLQQRLLYELDPADLVGIHYDPDFDASDVADAWCEAQVDPNRPDDGWYWGYSDGESDDLRFGPDPEGLAEQVAQAFATCPRWRLHKEAPRPTTWLLARLPELRPVLADLIAEATCGFLEEPTRFRSIREPIERLMRAVDWSSEPEHARDETLMHGLLLLASWRAFDVRPMAGTTLLYGLWKLCAETRSERALVDYAIFLTRQVLYAPHSLSHLLSCGASVRSLLQTSRRTLRMLVRIPARVDAHSEAFAPLEALLNEREGGEELAIAQIDALAAQGRHGLTELEARLSFWQSFPMTVKECGYVAACWAPWSTAPKQGVVGARVARLYAHVWSHRLKLLEPLALEALLRLGRKESLVAFLESCRQELAEGVHLPWMPAQLRQVDGVLCRAERQLGCPPGGPASDYSRSCSLRGAERAHEELYFGEDVCRFYLESPTEE